MAPSGIDPTTFQLVAQYFNHSRKGTNSLEKLIYYMIGCVIFLLCPMVVGES